MVLQKQEEESNLRVLLASRSALCEHPHHAFLQLQRRIEEMARVSQFFNSFILHCSHEFVAVTPIRDCAEWTLRAMMKQLAKEGHDVLMESGRGPDFVFITKYKNLSLS